MYDFDLSTPAKSKLPDTNLIAYPTEVRIINKSNRHKNSATIVNDRDELVAVLNAAVLRQNAGEPVNIYYIMNELQTGFQYDANSKAVKDSDITRRRFVLIDADPVRMNDEKEVSSTDDEKAKSFDVIKNIYTDLLAKGLPDSIIADSGNGYHMLLPVDLPNTPDTLNGIKRFLSELDTKYSNKHVKIDTSVCNASRITKAYGTRACKGANTSVRPHRLSRLLYVPETITPANATMFPVKVAQPQATGDLATPQALEAWMALHNIKHSGAIDYNDGVKYQLDVCPFNSEHKAPDSIVVITNDGKTWFNCSHTSCIGKKWNDFRRVYEPNYQPSAPTRLPQRIKNSAPERYNTWLPAYCEERGVYLIDRGTIGTINNGMVVRTSRTDTSDPITRRIYEDVKAYLMEDLSFTAKCREAIIDAMPMFPWDRYRASGIGFSNGWLDMSNGEWHGGECDLVFPVCYDFPRTTEYIETPLFRKLIEDQMSWENNKEFVLYMIGDCVSTVKSRVGGTGRAYLVKGEKGSGKSTLLNVIARLLPREAVYKASLADMAEPTVVNDCVGKTLVYSAEGFISAESDLVKKAVDGDELVSHKMYVNRSMVSLNCTFAWASNDMPMVKGHKQSVVDRISVLHFNKTFRGASGEIQGLDLEILNNERAALVNNALTTLLRYKATKTMPRSEFSTEDSIESDASSVHSFLAHCLSFTRKSLSCDRQTNSISSLKMKPLYDAYKSYMQEENGRRKAIPKRDFSDTWRTKVLPIFGYSVESANSQTKGKGDISFVTHQLFACGSDHDRYWTVAELIDRGVAKELIGATLKGSLKHAAELYATIVRFEQEDEETAGRDAIFTDLELEEQSIARKIAAEFGGEISDIVIE